MQYKQENEKVVMMPINGAYVPTRISLAEDPEIRRTRKILIIILSIFLVSVFFPNDLQSLLIDFYRLLILF